jgi:hypothetical protein
MVHTIFQSGDIGMGDSFYQIDKAWHGGMAYILSPQIGVNKDKSPHFAGIQLFHTSQCTWYDASLLVYLCYPRL